MASGRLVTSGNCDRPIGIVAFARDGLRVAAAGWTASGGRIWVLTLDGIGNSRVLKGPRARIDGMAWSNDGTVIVAASGKIAYAWSSFGGTATKLLVGKRWLTLHGALTDGTFILGDSKHAIWAVDQDGRVVWDDKLYGPVAVRGNTVAYALFGELTVRRGMETIAAPRLTHIPRAIAFAGRDDRLLASRPLTHRARIFDLGGRDLSRAVGHDCAIEDVHFSSDGRFVTCSEDGQVLVWRRGLSQPVWSWSSVGPPLPEVVKAVHFGPDGTIYAGESRRVVIISSEGATIARSECLKSDVCSIAWTPNGLLVFTEIAGRRAGERVVLDPITLQLQAKSIPTERTWRYEKHLSSTTVRVRYGASLCDINGSDGAVVASHMDVSATTEELVRTGAWVARRSEDNLLQFFAVSTGQLLAAHTPSLASPWWRAWAFPDESGILLSGEQGRIVEVVVGSARQHESTALEPLGG